MIRHLHEERNDVCKEICVEIDIHMHTRIGEDMCTDASVHLCTDITLDICSDYVQLHAHLHV